MKSGHCLTEPFFWTLETYFSHVMKLSTAEPLTNTTVQSSQHRAQLQSQLVSTKIMLTIFILILMLDASGGNGTVEEI